jgi:hypothetical protein
MRIHSTTTPQRLAGRANLQAQTIGGDASAACVLMSGIWISFLGMFGLPL